MASYTIEKPYNLYKILWLVEKRPGMYIGTNELSALDQFINAYTFCANMHDIEDEKIFPPFYYFHSWTKMIYTESRITTSGWYTTLLNASKNNQEEALKDFFQKLEIFKKLYPISIQKVILTEENKRYQASDKCKGWKKGTGEPLYENPQEIYLVEYSQNFGFAYFVIDNGKNHDRFDVYETKIDVLEILEKQFGKIENWEMIEGDLMETMDYLMKIR